MGSAIVPVTPVQLSISDVRFSSFSNQDTFGRVFFYNNRVFRLIAPEAELLCRSLFDEGVIDALHQHGLIPVTNIVGNLTITEHPDALIIEHEKLVETYIGEWTFSMLKQAAVCVLQVNQLLNKLGFALKDSHPYNVLFRGSTPLWIDMGSIEAKTSSWKGADEFLESFIVPLTLWVQGEFYLVNKILNDRWFPHHRFLPQQSITETKATRRSTFPFITRSICISRQGEPRSLSPRFFGDAFIVRAVNKCASLCGVTNLLAYKNELQPTEALIAKINTLQKHQSNSAWQNYHDIYKEQPTPRIDRIVQHVTELFPASVLDVAGNQGYVSRLIENQLNCSIINIDYDENALDLGYRASATTGSGINYALVNCMLSPQRDTGIFRRLKSDVVLALAITHHLILGQQFHIDFILNTLRKFTAKTLLIEFMPLGLWSKGEPHPPLPEWYNINWFTQHLGEYFEIAHQEQLEENRVLFIAHAR